MKAIAGKLVQVMAECSQVRKNGLNDFHHYKYATSADVLEKVNAALVKFKIASIVTPEVLQSSEVQNSKGNVEQRVTVRITVTLLDADSGESVQLVGLGSGQDGGDKAVMKAQTAAIKYAFLMGLAISTNDDPEADSRTDEGMSNTQGRGNGSSVGKAARCSDCDMPITPGVEKVSVNKFGRPLCMKCQKNQQGAA
ncbi:MAG: single-stranded DNA-binding protein [Negativicutes bacterium]|nr:single-stranded DNA-binding protein [Negativicutes bacterium]